MEGFNFERPPEQHSPVFNPEGVLQRERLTVEEIMGQLEVTKSKYEDALQRFEAGNYDDREYLEEYQANLVDWMNDIKIKEGTLSRGNQEIFEEIEKRLYMVSEALEPNKLQ